MQHQFKSIGLIGLPRHQEAIETHRILFEWLRSEGYQVFLEEELAVHLPYDKSYFAPLENIGLHAQLAIVIGGDGNMLRAAKALSAYNNIKVIGINRGNLGFLTDIAPDKAIESIADVLTGQYIVDPRFLLEATVYSKGKLVSQGIAINEVVIHPIKVAHMVDYQAYINGQNAFSQRADGLIIATPTGSTAYSLSAGGPIIAPGLDAFIITPMFPHSLSVRPLVIKSDNEIKLTFPTTRNKLEVTCDSQLNLPVRVKDEVIIKRAPYTFNLIHSCDYDYFSNLSSKLGWSQKMY
ncbi:MAG: NAD(+) kinase [Candidatus Schmidhempelia sp.]|nr:NAD(+) kinase [Candidatus Schmidhempelia sp.]